MNPKPNDIENDALRRGIVCKRLFELIEEAQKSVEDHEATHMTATKAAAQAARLRLLSAKVRSEAS